MEDKNNRFSQKISFNIRGNLTEFPDPMVMGILNLTPDSFYDGGKNKNMDAILLQVETMLLEGASIIDIGAVSSRPGAAEVSLEEERKRLFPVLKVLNQHFKNTIYSVDTYRSEIALQAVEEYGVSMINDISAGIIDNQMIKTVAACKVPYIVMHMKGKPETMQINPEYNNVTTDLIHFFSEKIAECHAAGIYDIIIDPGFGFGKTLQHNFVLLNELSSFKMFEKPILTGLSRKSMIQKVIDKKADECLNGTTALNMVALMNGASVLRVHDVKEAYQTIQLYQALKR